MGRGRKGVCRRLSSRHSCSPVSPQPSGVSPGTLPHPVHRGPSLALLGELDRYALQLGGLCWTPPPGATHLLPEPCLMERAEEHGGAGAGKKPSQSQRGLAVEENPAEWVLDWRSRRDRAHRHSGRCQRRALPVLPTTPPSWTLAWGEEPPRQLRHPVLREQET